MIEDSTAPTYAALRPLKSPTSSRFPVYPDAVERLVHATEVPDPMVAHFMATCAGYAYADAEIVGMIAARLGLAENQCLMIAQNVDAMFICSTAFLLQSADGRVVVLCYRGTQPVNFINWLADLDIDPDRVSFMFPDGAGPFDVHAGWYRNVRATRYQVISALQRALNGQSVRVDGAPVNHPMEALYLCGHSMGGAMAALMAVMLTTEPAYASIAEKLRGVYTFAQPMIGSPRFAEACDAHPFLGSHVARYILRNDVVPLLPPAAAGPFGHFGQEFRDLGPVGDGRWVRSDIAVKQISNLLELLQAPMAFLARQVSALRNIPFRFSLGDHAPQRYISALTPSDVVSEYGDQ